MYACKRAVSLLHMQCIGDVGTPRVSICNFSSSCSVALLCWVWGEGKRGGGGGGDRCKKNSSHGTGRPTVYAVLESQQQANADSNDRRLTVLCASVF